tara:strand:+ start:14862 stop:16466 length:1605 start_codon:yes stop_codon:yes gene_type:complete
MIEGNNALKLEQPRSYELNSDKSNIIPFDRGLHSENHSKNYTVISDMHGTTHPAKDYDRVTWNSHVEHPKIYDKVAKELGTDLEGLLDYKKKGDAADKGTPDFEKMVEVGDKLTLELLESGVTYPIFEDVSPVFNKLKSDGIDIHIYSSGGFEALQKNYDKSKLNGKTKEVHSAQDVGPKYDAQTYIGIMNKIGADPNFTVYVADNKKECAAAAQAGIKHVYFIDRSGKDHGKKEEGYKIIKEYGEITEHLNGQEKVNFVDFAEFIKSGHGTKEVKLVMRRHSHKGKGKQGDQLTDEGHKYSEEIGREQLPGKEYEMEGISSPMNRTRQTLENLLKGGKRQDASRRTDARLKELPNDILDYMKKQPIHRDEKINNTLKKSDPVYKRAYELSASQMLSYIKSEIAYQLGHMNKGTKKWVESLSHGPKVDVSLAALLKLHGEDVKDVADLGGVFLECNHYTITVKQSSNGKIKASVNYRGKKVDLDPAKLGLSEKQMMEAMELGEENLEDVVEEFDGEDESGEFEGESGEAMGEAA